LTVIQGLLTILNGLWASFKREERHKNSTHYEKGTCTNVLFLNEIKIWMKLG